MLSLKFLHLIGILFSLYLFLRGFFPLKQMSLDVSSLKPSISACRSQQVHKQIDHSFDCEIEQNSQSEKGHFSPLVHDSWSHEGDSNATSHKKHSDSEKAFKRLIFMVIDAFRADFFMGPINYMPQTHKLMKKGKGKRFTALAHPPTITLSRLKAMMTGNIPSFSDVVMNFGSPALNEDNLVTQLKKDKKKIIFFGDDTWMKLFPDHFDRSDGTTSFFVTDYTEVDQNVSRHLPQELSRTDWDVMILHYLGLDHIGHLAGPGSPLIRPKLLEMDSVVKQIFSAMETWSEPSLLVVCGDHGMSDQGGHGGATPGEVSVPVIFLSPQARKKGSSSISKSVGPISQLDICPTLAVLMDVPIPLNSLGLVVTEALFDYPLPRRVSAVAVTVEQTLQVLKQYVAHLPKESSYLLYKRAEYEYDKWLSKANRTEPKAWLEEGEHLLSLYSESHKLMVEKVGKLTTRYDVYAMAAAMSMLTILLVSLCLAVLIGPVVTRRNQCRAVSVVARPGRTGHRRLLVLMGASLILTHITLCTEGVPSGQMCGHSMASVVIQVISAVVFLSSIFHLWTSVPHLSSLRTTLFNQWQETNILDKFVFLCTIGHTLSLLSSSFVEEEHQTFYFLAATLHLLMIVLVIQDLNCQSKVIRKEESFDLALYESSETQDHHLTHEGGDFHTKCAQRKLGSKGSSNQEMMSTDSVYEGNNSARDNDEHIPLSHDIVPTYANAGSNSELLPHDIKANRGLSLKEKQQFVAGLIAILALLRILRRLNQTGNKWMNLPDIGDWLILPEHKAYLSLLVATSMIMLSRIQQRCLPRVQATCLNLSLTATYLARAATGKVLLPGFAQLLSDRGITEARASFIFIGIILLKTVTPDSFFSLEISKSHKESDEREENNLSHEKQSEKKEKKLGLNLQSPEPWVRAKGFQAACLGLACLLLRAHNVPLVVCMAAVEQLASPVLVRLRVKPCSALLYCLWMGQAFFFLQGNSNSLTTVDVASGYVGIRDYQPVLIGTLICLALYIAPVFWMVTCVKVICLLHHNCCLKESLSSGLESVGTCLLLTRALPLSVYTSLVAAQRYHLFVWTVFSPKLLYEGAYCILMTHIALVFYVLSYLATT